MRFSIITATYNSEKTLERTIKSILNQGFNDCEYIIIDGYSKDGTIAIIKKYINIFESKNISFKWISEPDSGIYDAWNKGLKIASGEWISFLGSDDYYLNDALKAYEKKISAINSSKTDLIYSKVNVVKGSEIVKTIDGTWKWKIFKKYMNIAHVGAFHNSSYFKKYGAFNISYKIAGDYELLLRAKSNLKTSKLDYLTANMEAGGVSNNMIHKVFKETFRAKKETGNLNFVQCSYDYIIAYIKYIIRKNLI